MFLGSWKPGQHDPQIDELMTDSREKTQNGLFFSFRGKVRRPDFADQAGKAATWPWWFPHLDSPLPQVRVENVRSAMAHIASAFLASAKRCACSGFPAPG